MGMRITSRTILITGGASGIGLALARRLHARGNAIVLCGRRRHALQAASDELRGTLWRECDLSKDTERTALAAWVTEAAPALDVLVNNAGVQRYPRLQETLDWTAVREEIATNLDAPVHLSALLLPHLRAQQRAAIVNVTSGLSFVPYTRAPVYSATKAALHSYTLSLRQHLKGTNVDVVEVIPPAVDTDLGGPGLHTFGVPVDEFADAVMQGLERGNDEIAYGTAAQAMHATHEEREIIFARMNQPRSS
jgi:uncharacterized oxidoreductase